MNIILLGNKLTDGTAGSFWVFFFLLFCSPSSLYVVTHNKCRKREPHSYLVRCWMAPLQLFLFVNSPDMYIPVLDILTSITHLITWTVKYATEMLYTRSNDSTVALYFTLYYTLELSTTHQIKVASTFMIL